MIKLKLIPRSSRIIAMTVFPFLLVNPRLYPLKDKTVNHENIHAVQQIEVGLAAIIVLLLFGGGWYSLFGCLAFYVMYVGEWAIRGFDYYAISFEREAYTNDWDIGYLNGRKPFSWIKYLNK